MILEQMFGLLIFLLLLGLVLVVLAGFVAGGFWLYTAYKEWREEMKRYE